MTWPLPHPLGDYSAPATPGSDQHLVLLLDSSESATNAQEYALQLAGVQGCDLEMLYVIDVDQFPESGNPVSMSRLLAEEHKTCSARLSSCRNRAEGKDMKIGASEPVVVGVFQLEVLHETIRRLAPDLVVVSRVSFRRGFLNAVVRNASCPVLIVPETQAATRLNSMLLYSDGKRLKERWLHPVLNFAARTRQKISVLSIVQEGKSGMRKFQSYLPSSAGTSLVDFYRQEGVSSILTIEKFIRKGSFDMVSMILRDHWWFRRLFYRWSCIDLAFGVDVPLLVFKAK
jgi:nucleotide-binding universal stress UspA family protein